jgi:ABC-type transport system substrate-binding protein
MKLKSTEWIIVILSVLLLMSTNSMVSVFPSVWDPPTNPSYAETYEKYGPRVTDIIFDIVPGGVAGEALALNDGDIDAMDWPAPASYIPSWSADTGVGANIWMGPTIGLWYYEFDINLQNWPMGDGLGESVGGLTFPTPNGEGEPSINYTRQRAQDCRELRKALSYLYDRDQLITYMQGYGVALDTFIPPVIGGWEKFANGTSFFDPSLANPVPTYEFNMTKAEELLWNAGWRDYDTDGDLEYSKTRSSTPGEYEELPAIEFWIRSDDQYRKKGGQILWGNMEAVGFQVNGHIESKSNCYDHAWQIYDYHIYTGGWDIGREPDYYYDFWHSSMDTFPDPGANNYMRYNRSDYDTHAEALKYALTLDEAREALYHCEYMVADDVAGIPMFTDIGFVPARKQYTGGPSPVPSEELNYVGEDWRGLVNEKGTGFYSWFTQLNAHPGIFEKGGVFRLGFVNDVESFNPVHAEWFWDWLVLETIYDYLIQSNPLDLSENIPWMCTNYYTGSWYNSTSATWGSYMHLDLIDNILWHGTTNHFTAYDVKCSFETMYRTKCVPFYSYVEKLDHIDIIDDFTVEIFYSVESVWLESWIGAIPMIPEYIWGPMTVEEIWEERPEVDGTLVGTGPFMYHSRSLSEWIRVTENPYYFRTLVWPDVKAGPGTPPGAKDKIVGLDDFMKVTEPGNWLASENPDGTWPSPPGAWGPECDVNYDGTINAGDLFAINARYVPGVPSWPPSYYE